MSLKWKYAVLSFIGLLVGVFITRYAPECEAGLCWGQTPFLLMLVAGAFVSNTKSLSKNTKRISIWSAGAIAGGLLGVCISFGGGLYAFLGGTTAIANLESPTAMALVPNPLMIIIGSVLGLFGTTSMVAIGWGMARIRRAN